MVIMAAPAKKREIDDKSRGNEEMNSSNDSSDDNDMDTNDEQVKTIKILRDIWEFGLGSF